VRATCLASAPMVWNSTVRGTRAQHTVTSSILPCLVYSWTRRLGAPVLVMSSCIFDYVFDGIPQSTKDYCVQYPLFANLINDTSLHPIRTPGRDAGIDASTFINQTMNTEDTFAACQSFYKSPSPSASTQGDLNLGEFQTFYCLGTGLSLMAASCRQ